MRFFLFKQKSKLFLYWCPKSALREGIWASATEVGKLVSQDFLGMGSLIEVPWVHWKFF